jgi:hypothetical protein
MPDLGDRQPEILGKLKRVDIIGKVVLLVAVVGTIVAVIALLKK